MLIFPILLLILIVDAKLFLSMKPVNDTYYTSNMPSASTLPILETFILPWINTSDIYRDVHKNCSPMVSVKVPHAFVFGQQIHKFIFPLYLPNADKVIGDKESQELIVGDEAKDIPTVAFSSILKKRHKRMKKHKYRKRRKLEVFKRRRLQNIKDRKRRAKERKEERQMQEKGVSG